MLEAGLANFLEPGLAERKLPRFDSNRDFDFSVFGETFDYVVARPVWTHASKAHIRAMLEGFERFSTDDAIFLTSYKRASLFRRDYQGDQWRGRSHVSDVPGTVYHSFSWVRQECQRRNLEAVEIRERAFNFGTQVWLRIVKRATPVREP
jgi:hypothetical protein